MKFGVSVATVGAFADPSVHVDLARRAEASGWDGYFVWDGVAHAHRPVLEPWVGLAAVAAATERITLGPLVSAIVFHRPRQLTATIATLSRLSHGRLIVGVGASDAPEAELSSMGEPALPERIALLERTLREVTAALDVEGLSVPFWVAASDPVRGRAALRRARRYAGVCPMGIDRDPAQVRELVEYVRRGRTSPIDVVIFSNFATTRRSEATSLMRSYADAGATWMIETLVPWTSPPGTAVTVLQNGPPR